MELNEETIPIVIAVRKQSERCPNKVCRDFYNGKSLTNIALEKFRGRKDVYFSAYEDEFKSLADEYEVNFIPRPYESAMGETQDVIRGYLKDSFPYKNILSYNVCCPFTKAETVDKAIACYKKNKLDALMLVHETYEVILDHNMHPISPDAQVFNSKMRRPQYQITNNFMIFNMIRFWKLGAKVIEKYRNDDPYFFSIDVNETLDIDTEQQFQVVKNIYSQISNAK